MDNLIKKQKNVIKKLINLVKNGAYHDDNYGYYFKHQDLRDLAYEARERYGMDLFFKLDPQRLCYLALIAISTKNLENDFLSVSNLSIDKRLDDYKNYKYENYNLITKYEKDIKIF